MSICSRWGAAALAGSVMSVLVLAGTHAQQATPSPARRAGGAASSVRAAAPVPIPAAEGGGFKMEYRDIAVAPGWAVSPEAQKLQASEIAAANEANTLSQQLGQASADSQREELKGKLRDALNRQFDAQQKRRAAEIASIEERLGKLKETLSTRNAAKEAIVGRRLDQLMGVKDELAWEETGAFPTAGVTGALNWNPNAARYSPLAIPPTGTITPGFAPGISPPSSPFQILPTVPVPTAPAWPASPPPAAVPATPALPAPAAPATAPAAPAAPTPREPGAAPALREPGEAPAAPTPREPGVVQPSLEPSAVMP